MTAADDWNKVICSWFFGEHARGQLVYLGIDDAELERMAGAGGLAVEKPRDSFLGAMAAASSGGDPFGYWRRAAAIWHRIPPPRPCPPFVSVLALTTLIADDATRRRSQAFYEPLAEALGASEQAVRETFEDSVRLWWGLLGVWLTEHEGRLGLPTARAPTHGFRSIVGHAWSQVLVRRPDRAHFTEFFAWLGVPDIADLELDKDRAPEDLFYRWRAWVRRGGPASERLRRVIDDPEGARSEEGRIVARILVDELSHWDGVARDAERRASLRVVIGANTFDRRELFFLAVVPAELAGRTVEFPRGAVRLGDEGDLTEVPLPVTAPALESGIRLSCSGLTLAYSPRRVVPMARREGVDLWRSVDQLAAGEEAYALVAQPQVDAVLALVPEAGLSTAITNVPEGWSLLRDVELLADLALDPGEHVVAAGARRFRILLEPFDYWAPPIEPPLAQALVRRGHSCIPAGYSRPGHATGQMVVLAGAFVRGLETRPTPLLLPVRPGLLILGRPGEASRVEATLPPWVHQLGLSLYAFEPLARLSYSGGRPFVPNWVAWETDTGAYAVAPCAGAPDLRRAAHPDMPGWTRLVKGLAGAEVVGGEQALRWWDSYVSLAYPPARTASHG
ncbi:MAG: hypothetical protein LC808_04995 [Actinobacteria bacterium]|nr:hypothetical protein [Actinomycetota bacterium]